MNGQIDSDNKQTEDDTVVSSWRLPSIGKKKVVKSAKREQKEKSAETIEDVPRHAKPKPLTADQLKKIADQAQQEGYADGFKEGMEKGLSQGTTQGKTAGEKKAYAETRTRLEAEKKRITDIANQLLDPMQSQSAELETQLVSLVLGLAEKLVGDTVIAEPKKLANVVNKAISALPVGAKNITVFVNDDDAKLLDEVIPETHRNWRLSDDNSLSSGGCRVETADSLIDYSIETRLQQYLQEVDELPDAAPEIDAGESTAAAPASKPTASSTATPAAASAARNLSRQKPPVQKPPVQKPPVQSRPQPKPQPQQNNDTQQTLRTRADDVENKPKKDPKGSPS